MAKAKKKARRLTKSALSNFNAVELRRIAQLGMGLPLEQSFHMKPGDLVTWIYSNTQRFIDEVDLYEVDKRTEANPDTQFRVGMLGYLNALLGWLREEYDDPPVLGEEEDPDLWSDGEEEDEEEEQEAVYEEVEEYWIEPDLEEEQYEDPESDLHVDEAVYEEIEEPGVEPDLEEDDPGDTGDEQVSLDFENTNEAVEASPTEAAARIMSLRGSGAPKRTERATTPPILPADPGFSPDQRAGEVARDILERMAALEKSASAFPALLAIMRKFEGEVRALQEEVRHNRRMLQLLLGSAGIEEPDPIGAAALLNPDEFGDAAHDYAD